MRALTLALLCLVGAASVQAAPAAKSRKAKPAPAVAMPVPAPAPASVHLALRLKDGQTADVQLVRYDSVFLSVRNAKGTQFDLPWGEVAAISSGDAGPDLALMLGRLTAEPSPVGTQLEPRSSGAAFGQALWPGILLHGAGHRYAGDQDTFFSLAGGELFGLVVGGFGLAELLGPEKTGESKDTALALSSAGGIIFGLTWLWDLGFAPGAADKFNQAHGLALKPTPNGAQLAYRF